MKIGMITDSLPDTGFDGMLAIAARLGMEMLEFGCGNWSTAPHVDRAAQSVTAPLHSCGSWPASTRSFATSFTQLTYSP